MNCRIFLVTAKDIISHIPRWIGDDANTANILYCPVTFRHVHGVFRRRYFPPFSLFAFCFVMCAPTIAFMRIYTLHTKNRDNGRTAAHVKSTPPDRCIILLFYFNSYNMVTNCVHCTSSIYTYRPYYTCIYIYIYRWSVYNIIMCRAVYYYIIWFAAANDTILHVIIMLFALDLFIISRSLVANNGPSYPHPNRISFSLHYAAIVLGF